MFGIKRMHRQRNRLYERTKRMEKRATASRKKAKESALDMATSPAGLIASFVLGATTQCDISHKARRNLLSGASRDILSFLTTQVMAFMAAQPSDDVEASTDPAQDSAEPSTTPQQDNEMPAQDASNP